MLFEVVLDDVAGEFCFTVLFEDDVVDAELDGMLVLGVGFGWVRDEVIVVEVGDEAGKFGFGGVGWCWQ